MAAVAAEPPSPRLSRKRIAVSCDWVRAGIGSQALHTWHLKMGCQRQSLAISEVSVSKKICWILHHVQSIPTARLDSPWEEGARGTWPPRSSLRPCHQSPSWRESPAATWAEKETTATPIGTAADDILLPSGHSMMMNFFLSTFLLKKFNRNATKNCAI